MKFKVTISIIGVLLILAASNLRTFAQSPVSPQKRALIKELLEVTEAVKLAESTSQTMLEQMEQDFPRIMEMLLTQQAADNQLTEAQRKALLEDSAKSSVRMLKRFQERALAAIKYGELLETISLELYDKYFTEEELKDMVAFYRTPTGKKTVQVMPKLVNDTMQKSTEIVLPKIMGVLDELIKEEIKRIK